MAIGKLYRSSDEQFVADVDYHLQNESSTSWWGELILTEYSRLVDGGGYIIEIADKRKG